MHHPTDRITHPTAFVTPVVEHWLEQEITQWSTMKDRSDDLSHHERTLVPMLLLMMTTTMMMMMMMMKKQLFVSVFVCVAFFGGFNFVANITVNF